jgi:hypothetical protein
MGYAVILMLFFYLVVATLMWLSGIFIPDTSDMREQADVFMLILSGVIIIGVAFYGRKELNRPKDATSEKGRTIGRLIRGAGFVGAVIISLVAIAKLIAWGSKHAPLPIKQSVSVPVKETWEEAKLRKSEICYGRSA